MVPTPYFPTIIEREQKRANDEDAQSCCEKFKGDHLPFNSISNSNIVGEASGGTDLGFGIRRRHRCYVVTARARSFLYHQVGIVSFSTSLFLGSLL